MIVQKITQKGKKENARSFPLQFRGVQSK